MERYIGFNHSHGKGLLFIDGDSQFEMESEQKSRSSFCLV